MIRSAKRSCRPGFRRPHLSFLSVFSVGTFLELRFAPQDRKVGVATRPVGVAEAGAPCLASASMPRPPCRAGRRCRRRCSAPSLRWGGATSRASPRAWRPRRGRQRRSWRRGGCARGRPRAPPEVHLERLDGALGHVRPISALPRALRSSAPARRRCSRCPEASIALLGEVGDLLVADPAEKSKRSSRWCAPSCCAYARSPGGRWRTASAGSPREYRIQPWATITSGSSARSARAPPRRPRARSIQPSPGSKYRGRSASVGDRRMGRARSSGSSGHGAVVHLERELEVLPRQPAGVAAAPQVGS